MTEFLCGGVAASMAICVMNPVDVVKTRMQLQMAAASASVAAERVMYRGVGSSLLQIARAEGLRGLQRGLSAAVVFQFYMTSARFGVYALGKRVMGTDTAGSSAQAYASRVALAMGSGACGAILGCPFYRLKTQFQATSTVTSLAVGEQHPHRNLREAIAAAYRSHGLLGFWRGLSVFLPRVMAFSGVQLTTYDAAKAMGMTRLGLSEGVPLHLLASVTAALLGITVMQPFDFVATRMMNQKMEKGMPTMYRGPVDLLRKVLSVEGPTALFKGASANYLRICPYTVLTFVFFEQLKLMCTSAAPLNRNSRN